MTRKKKKTGVVSLDFSGVEARVLVKEGEYLVKVSEVTEEEGDKAPYLKWKFEVAESKFEGAALYYITSLSEKSLWNLKSLLEALSVELPEDAVDLDLADMVDLELMVTVEHDTYEGKKQARIVDFWAAEGDKDEDDGKKSKKDKKKSKGKKSKKKDVPDADAINDMDEDEIKEVIEEHSLEIDPDDFPKIKALRKEVIKALEDAGEGEEEDEDDGKKSKKDKKKSKGKKDAVDQDAINEMSEEELEEFVEEHELEIKLSKYKTLRKKQAAVIDAGTEAGVVED